MERCHLNPTIPDVNSTSFDPAVNVDLTSEIDIWMLDNSQELSRHILWTRAPPRRSLFATIDLDGQGQKAIEFHCPSTSFTTFEFTCSQRTPDCQVDFWQKKDDPPNGMCPSNLVTKLYITSSGVYMVQHDSSGWRT